MVNLGLANIIFYVIAIFLPIMLLTGIYTPLEEQLYISYNVFRDILEFLPYFITYGLGFYFFGMRNREVYHNFLRYAGIIFMILYTLMAIVLLSNFYEVLSTISGLDIISNYLIFILISTISSIIGNIAIIFILVHSIKFKDNLLLVGSIIMLIASGISLVLNLSYFSLLI
ncbi:MAG: hypothetical protein EAX89_14415 [Candidatus Lokiarchaeota archaeon]|nr:hypothetical protein [Candidatus Lokiarchaeota archaeon]